MDQNDGSAQRRPRQQLSCVQCRRRKVKCDHERPCRRCRIRGWTTQCAYPLDTLGVQSHSGSAANSPRRSSVGRDWQSASPRATHAAPVSTLIAPPAPSHPTPSEPTDLATPESVAVETPYGFYPSRTSPARPAHRTVSEPAPLATPNTASPHTLPRAPSIASTTSHARPRESNRYGGVNSEPESGPDYALYLINGESVYFGRSSAPWLISKFTHIMSYIDHKKAGDHADHVTFVRLKRMSSQQVALAESQDELDHPSLGLSSEVPSRDVTDLLVKRYFQSYERIFPLFGHASFWKNYESFWRAPHQASLVYVMILLLTIGMGNSTMPHDQRRLPRSKIIRWWRLALTWQGAASETNERMVSTLQANCLIVMMRQVYSLSETAEWLSSGAVVKNALAMGLHRDPSKLVGLPTEEYELRRRLWYTILELDLQYCLNAGMVPTARLGDWDTLPPVVKDDDGMFGRGNSRESKAVRRHLLDSFRVRMEIASVVNSIVPEDNYDRILDLGNQLTRTMNHPQLSGNRPTSDTNQSDATCCQIELLKFLYHRYLLTLHVPFALRGDPKYAFSQNICLTSSLAILDQFCPSTSTTPIIPYADENVCTTALHTSGLFFKNGAFYATLYLCHELIREPPSATPAAQPSAHTPLSAAAAWVQQYPATNNHARYAQHNPVNLVRQLPSVQQRVVEVIERFVKLAEERLRTTQFAGKAFLIPRMVLAYHRISEDPDVTTDEEKERRLREAGTVIGEICLEIFCSNPDVAKVL